MNDESIRNTILALFRKRESLKDVGEDDDFFDQGVSSLTIIELQIAVEDALKVTLPTSQLMRLSTMSQWVEAYSRTASPEMRQVS